MEEKKLRVVSMLGLKTGSYYRQSLHQETHLKLWQWNRIIFFADAEQSDVDSIGECRALQTRSMSSAVVRECRPDGTQEDEAEI